MLRKNSAVSVLPCKCEGKKVFLFSQEIYLGIYVELQNW